MKIRFKILSIQGTLLLVTILSLVGFVVIFNNSIRPLIDTVAQDVDVLRRTNTLEELIVSMKSLREDLDQNTHSYIDLSSESTVTKYNFASQKLGGVINQALKESIQGTILFNISVVEANIENIEKDIFLLVDQNKEKEARALQLSSEYEVLHENYHIFIEQFIFSNKAEAEDQFSKLVLLSASIEASKKRLNNLIVIALASFASLFALGIGFSFILARSISKPLEQLTKGAEIIGKGNLNYRINIKSKGEIGDLAASFNQMTDSLLESRKLPENILRSIKDSLFVIDTNGNITNVNQAVLDQLGYERQEIIGKPITLAFVVKDKKISKT